MLKDKVAIVTGAGSGIGRAIALAYAREGANVVVSDTNAGAGEETVALLRRAGGEGLFAAADVERAEDCAALVARAASAYGRLDIACNNAGIGGDLAPTADYPLDAWQRVIAVNLSGVFHCMKYEIGRMLDVGRLGNVEEVAEVVLWLSGPGASFTSGGYYPVDGGYLAR